MGYSNLAHLMTCLCASRALKPLCVLNLNVQGFGETKPEDQLQFLEVFAGNCQDAAKLVGLWPGSGILSSACEWLGMKSLAMDVQNL